ncbi:MAG TPA: hypothetical protein VM008_00290 [Phycisphaerae bacterium]|nr:hypothetical protein [Phycisphaerae bacterium]
MRTPTITRFYATFTEKNLNIMRHGQQTFCLRDEARCGHAIGGCEHYLWSLPATGHNFRSFHPVSPSLESIHDPPMERDSLPYSTIPVPPALLRALLGPHIRRPKLDDACPSKSAREPSGEKETQILFALGWHYV